MKGFESGLSYLRAEALKAGLIAESDNDDTLIERMACCIRGQDPLKTEKAKAKENKKASAREPSSSKNVKK